MCFIPKPLFLLPGRGPFIVLCEPWRPDRLAAERYALRPRADYLPFTASIEGDNFASVKSEWNGRRNRRAFPPSAHASAPYLPKLAHQNGLDGARQTNPLAAGWGAKRGVARRRQRA